MTPHLEGTSHGAHAMTACARVFSSRTVHALCLGEHGTVGSKAEERGTHVQDGHNLHLTSCMLQIEKHKMRRDILDLPTNLACMC
jgi:hypothetical protein